MNHDPPMMNARSSIVVTVEGLGARWLEPWGCGSVRTPAVNRLATSGLVIENAHALYGDAVQQWNHWMQPVHGPPDRDWLSKLKDSGRTAVLMTDSSAIASASESHFQEIVEVEPARAETAANELASTHFVSFFAGASELARTLPEQGTLLWIHTTGFELPWDAPWEMRQAAQGDEDPDPPREPGPPEFSTGLNKSISSDLITGWQQAMAAQVHVFDLALSQFLDSVLDPDTCSNIPLFCFTATGGYGLGEHFRIGPARPELFHDEYLHVPFLCSFPDSGIGNFRISSLMTVDRLTSVLAGWMNGEPAEKILDLSVFPDRSRQVVYCKSAIARMIRTPTWKLLQTGDNRQLFLKPDDRWDQNDVAGLCHNIADQLSATLDQLPDSSGDGMDSDQPPLAGELTQRVD